MSEHERYLIGVQSHPHIGDGEQIGDLIAPQLGGLFMTPLLVAEYIKYGFENWDGIQSP